jgi:benzoyl-CoA reductase/2-hydroxyglutaryl-CoA dehydratase subunit BcrC/BadD/HgdB
VNTTDDTATTTRDDDGDAPNRGPAGRISRAAYLAEQRRRFGRSAVAALPIDHPREIATAGGRVTVELWGPPGIASGRSQAWLPSFACPLTRNALEWILRGEVAAAADLLVVPHACDSLQALAGQVIDLGAGRGLPAVTFYPPRALDGGGRYLRDEIRRYREAIAERLGPVDDGALAHAVVRHREADRLARRLLDEGPREGLAESDRFALLRRREWLWVDDQVAAFAEASARPALGRAAPGVPILLSGIVAEPAGLHDTLDVAGLRVAWDDTASLGRRLPERLPPPAADPIEDIARRFEAQAPCPTRSLDPAARIDRLVARARGAGVRGALFIEVAHCEPELFELPALRRALAAAGIPSLVVETELEASVPPAMRTRVEAFAESLAGERPATVSIPCPPPLDAPRRPSPLRRLEHAAVGRIGGPVAIAVNAALRRRRGVRAAKPPFGPPLRAWIALRAVLERYYLEGRSADGARPVAWVTSGAPVEVLRPLDYYVVYPENHAAICGARRRAQALCESAERAGYARNLCSYARTDFGALFSGKTPVGRIPRPDLLVACTNICQTVAGWYRALAHETGIPLVVIDTPFLQGGLRPHHVPYVREQIERLASEAERVARRTIRSADLARTLARAQEASFLWGECLAASRARPAPWFGQESFLHMAPIVVLRGTDAAVRYYRDLLLELRERVDRGIGGLSSERIRLLWDNLPVWPELRRLADLLAGRGANFVGATYTHAWSDCTVLMGGAEPFEALARTYASVLLNRDLADRAEGLADLARRYGADGILFHADRSCRPYSIGQHGLRERLARVHGVPGIVVEADHNDPRDVAWEATANRIEAFLEGLGGE